MKTQPLELAVAVCLLGTINAPASVRYVDVNSINPSPPFTNWATAAANIQDAIDMADVGDQILVTNGVYQTGGRAFPPYYLTNRVVIDKAVTVQSVNGPQVTVIKGQGPGGISAVRCVYLIDGAALVGFTLTKGATWINAYYLQDRGGGGVWCESTNAIVSNCLLIGNSAYDYGGGGAHSGTLNNCTLAANSAYDNGGGARYSTLNNCTLSSNAVSRYGGGVSAGTVNNCILSGNSALYGGGANSCTLNNSTLSNNSASSGGGAIYGILNNCSLFANSGQSGGGTFNAALNNCTLTGNSASSSGGGTSGGTLNNCIVYYNNAPTNPNYAGGTLNYCCTMPLPGSGTGNITNEPQLASTSHLSASSPCRRAGSTAYANGVDIDGEAWANPPSISCDEYHPGAVTGPLSVAIQATYTNVATQFEVKFTAQIEGRLNASRWDFGDGTVVSNWPYAFHSWVTAGNYSVTLTAYNESHPEGISATVMAYVLESVHHVALASTNPVPPYNLWATAATNIQDAVDAASVPGALILVSNGVYQTGGRVVYGAMTNRVAVTKPVTVQSVNGPQFTFIQGYRVPSTTNGNGAIRCVYLTNGATLVGFTLTNGATRGHAGGDSARERSGGGVWCESTSAAVSNCVLTGNSAYNYGGGAYQGSLTHCTFIGNSAWELGGGAYSSTLNNCTIISNTATSGGGTHSSTLSDCTLTGNRASASSGYGGGASQGNLINCTLTGNSAWAGGGANVSSAWVIGCTFSNNSAYGGGGVYVQQSVGTLVNCILAGNTAGDGGGVFGRGCKLINCTLTANSAGRGGGIWNSGAYASTLNNCVVYDNVASSGLNYSGSTLNYCCTTPLPDSGTGNFTNAPLFVNQAVGNLRLQSNSPCVNSGRNTYAPTGPDLDGNPRIVGGTVDVGAYEFQSPASVLSYAWAQQNGLPTDGSADFTDADGDGMNNWQEWRCDTVPTNAASVLRMLSPTVGESGITVSWASVSTRSYWLERATHLSAPLFVTLRSNIAGQAGTTAYLDTNAVASGPFFYRVGVQP